MTETPATKYQDERWENTFTGQVSTGEWIRGICSSDLVTDWILDGRHGFFGSRVGSVATIKYAKHHRPIPYKRVR